MAEERCVIEEVCRISWLTYHWPATGHYRLEEPSMVPSELSEKMTAVLMPKIIALDFHQLLPWAPSRALPPFKSCDNSTVRKWK